MHHMTEEGCPGYGRLQHARIITTIVMPYDLSVDEGEEQHDDNRRTDLLVSKA
jgi:hypothetical protein